MKNFSNTLVELVTTIPMPDAQAEMIVYTFLLPGKMIFVDYYQLVRRFYEIQNRAVARAEFIPL